MISFAKIVYVIIVIITCRRNKDVRNATKMRFYKLRFRHFQSILCKVLYSLCMFLKQSCASEHRWHLSLIRCFHHSVKNTVGKKSLTHPTVKTEGGLTNNGSSILQWVPQLYCVIRKGGLHVEGGILGII